MNKVIKISQRNIEIACKDILEILNYEEEDIIFLGGSLIEGSNNILSKGMGNNLSDIDVFILSNDIKKINRDSVDYDNNEFFKTQFKRIYGISLDIEIFSKNIIIDLIDQLNRHDFDSDKRTLNIIKLPNGFDFMNFTSFIHRFINGIPIHNEDLYNDLRKFLNHDKYFRLMTRFFVNNVDIYYEDVVGNIENNQLEVAVNVARTILLESIKAYIFYKKTSLDRDKWIPLIIKNLADYDEEASAIYNQFRRLLFEEKLDNPKSLRMNAENILSFSNDIISIIGQGGGI
jgi:hypothetical protein